MPQLVLLRHGQSQWNAENLFTGWHDVDLTELGESEAREAGRLLAADGRLDLRVLHTSLLTRAIRTADLALEAAGRSWLPVRRHWRLNERHYGDLQGKNKKETAQQFGEAQVKEWRRSYAAPPPAVEPGSPHHPVGDPRYRDVPADVLPRTECLADVVGRTIPYWEDSIVPDLLAEGARGGAVLVVAHGNSLRALRKHIEGIADERHHRTRDPDRHPLRVPPGRRPQCPVRRLSGRSRGRPCGGRGRRPPGGLTGQAG